MHIVIMPGLDGTGALSTGFAAQLQANHDVTVLCYPADMTSYADLTSFVSQRLPSDDFIIVAESFSGPLAILIAASQPPRLRGLVLIATFARAPRPGLGVLSRVLKVLPLRSQLLIWLAQPALMGKWATSGFAQTFRSALAPVPSAALCARLQAVATVDVRGDLNRITVPVTYVSARNDWLIPAKASDDFRAARIPVTKVDGPHFLLHANPDDCAEETRRFVSTVNPPSLPA